MKQLKHILVSVLALFFVTACVNKVETANTANKQVPKKVKATITPLATAENLTNLHKTADLVNPKIARFFAQTTKYEAALKKEWLDTSLTKTPLVIYHTNSEKPKFYEYRILDENDKEIGAIVSSADKSDGIVVRYFLEKTRKVTEEVAQKLTKGDWRLVDAGYPENFLAQDKNNNFYKASSGEKYQLTRDDYPEQSALDYYKNTSEEKILADFKAKDINSKEIVRAKDEAQKLADAGKKMWQQIDAQEAEILKVTGEDLARIFVEVESEIIEAETAARTAKSPSDSDSSSTNTANKTYVKEVKLTPEPVALAWRWYGFGKDLLRRIHRVSYVAKPWDQVAYGHRPVFYASPNSYERVDDYCGPFIINATVLGLAAKTPIGDINKNYNVRVPNYSILNEYYIKSANKNDLYDITTTIYKNHQANRSLFYSLAKNRKNNMYKYVHDSIGAGAMSPFRIYEYIERFTDKSFTAAHYYGHHNWYKARNHIRSYNLPLVTLRSSKWPVADWHYRLIYQTSVIRSIYRHRFMWWTWGSHSDNHWYKMHDNGTDNGAFWEYSYQYYNLSMIGIYNPKDL